MFFFFFIQTLYIGLPNNISMGSCWWAKSSDFLSFSEHFLRKVLYVWILAILKLEYNSFLLSERPEITIIIVVKSMSFGTSLSIQYSLLVYHTKFCPRRYLSSLSQDFSWDEMLSTQCQCECILPISQSETFSSTAVNHKISIYTPDIDVMWRAMKESEWLEQLFVYLTDGFLIMLWVLLLFSTLVLNSLWREIIQLSSSWSEGRR